jgi:preprotein translocase subunit SecF
MNIVKYRKIFYSISAVLVVASFVVLGMWGLNLGIDFKGGSLIEVEYQGTRPEVEMVRKELAPLNVGATVRATGDNGYLIKTNTLDQAAHGKVLAALGVGTDSKITEKRFNTIGPLLGREAAMNSLASIFSVILVIVIFITWAFRQVSKPVASWKYGLIAIVALIHDVIIPTGVFVVLGKYAGYEVDTLFVTALLVILGFSIHDTIVVFDRVREHLKNSSPERQKNEFDKIVGESISETMSRSINTSFTTLLAILALYFVGPESTKHFSLVLAIGIIAGTYSSVFLGSPLLVTVQKWQDRKAAKGKKK